MACFFLIFFSNSPGGLSGGLEGSPGLSGGPVWLEKLIDSLTWRLFESPGFVFRPVSARLGLDASSFTAKLLVLIPRT